MKKSILFLAFALISLNANWDINMQECINKSNAKACENFTKKLSNECENKDKISCFIYADMDVALAQRKMHKNLLRYLDRSVMTVVARLAMS